MRCLKKRVEAQEELSIVWLGSIFEISGNICFVPIGQEFVVLPIKHVVSSYRVVPENLKRDIGTTCAAS